MQLGLMIWPVQWDLWGFNQDELGHISMHICHTPSGISNIRIWNIRKWHIRIWNSYAKEAFFFLKWFCLRYSYGAGWHRCILLKIPTLGSPERFYADVECSWCWSCWSLRTNLRRGFLVTSYEVFEFCETMGFLSMTFPPQPPSKRLPLGWSCLLENEIFCQDRCWYGFAEHI